MPPNKRFSSLSSNNNIHGGIHFQQLMPSVFVYCSMPSPAPLPRRAALSRHPTVYHAHEFIHPCFRRCLPSGAVSTDAAADIDIHIKVLQ